MNYAGSIAVVIMFVVLIYVLRLVRQAQEVLAISRDSMGVLRDASLDDETKEKFFQTSAIRLFRLLLLMLVGTAIALLAPIGVIWLLDRAGIVSLDAVLAILVRWDFIVAASVVSIGAYIVLERRGR
jgi:hypothetical protein